MKGLKKRKLNVAGRQQGTKGGMTEAGKMKALVMSLFFNILVEP
jgi:hypothetical protein